jgi:hypothetical protein
MCSWRNGGQAGFFRECVEGPAVLAGAELREGVADGVRGWGDFGVAFLTDVLVLGGLPGSAGALRPDCKANN